MTVSYTLSGITQPIPFGIFSIIDSYTVVITPNSLLNLGTYWMEIKVTDPAGNYAIMNKPWFIVNHPPYWAKNIPD